MGPAHPAPASRTLLQVLASYGVDRFLLLLLGIIAIAAVLPDLGRTDGLLHLNLLASYGIGIVFFLRGLTLAPGQLRAGLANWRLHLAVQGTVFLAFPLVAGAVIRIAGEAMGSAVSAGIFFLAALPAATTSPVAMTALARGNVAGAIVSGTFSMFLGVLVTPLWMDWYLTDSGMALDLADVFFRMVLVIILPILLGQAMRALLRSAVKEALSGLRWLDQLTLFALVMNSFSDSVHEQVWRDTGVLTLLALVLLCLALVVIVAALTILVAGYLGLGRGDTVAAIFCGTKKSLGDGVRMADIMFAGSPVIGVVILPVMIFHFLQLLLAALLARFLSRNEESIRASLAVLLRALGRARAARVVASMALVLTGTTLALLLGVPAPMVLGPALGGVAVQFAGLPSCLPRRASAAAEMGFGLLLGVLAGHAAPASWRLVLEVLVFGTGLLVLLSVFLAPVVEGLAARMGVGLFRSSLPGAARPGMPRDHSSAADRLRDLLALVLVAGIVGATGTAGSVPETLTTGTAPAELLVLLAAGATGLGWVARGCGLARPWLAGGMVSGVAGVAVCGVPAVPLAPLLALAGQCFAGYAAGVCSPGWRWLHRAGLRALSPNIVPAVLAGGIAAVLSMVTPVPFAVLLVLLCPLRALAAGALAVALFLPDAGLVAAGALLREGALHVVKRVATWLSAR